MSHGPFDEATDALTDAIHGRNTPEPQAEPAGHEPEQPHPYTDQDREPDAGYPPEDGDYELADDDGMTIEQASDIITSLGEAWHEMNAHEQQQAVEFIDAVVGDVASDLAAAGFSVDTFATALEQTGDLAAALAVVEAEGPEARDVGDATDQLLEWVRQVREAEHQ